MNQNPIPDKLPRVTRQKPELELAPVSLAGHHMSTPLDFSFTAERGDQYAFHAQGPSEHPDRCDSSRHSKSFRGEEVGGNVSIRRIAKAVAFLFEEGLLLGAAVVGLNSFSKATQAIMKAESAALVLLGVGIAVYKAVSAVRSARRQN